MLQSVRVLSPLLSLLLLLLSAIAGYTLVNQILAGAVSILRGFVLLCSILMGLYGFMLAGFVIVLYISRLRSFGIPYLALVFPKSSSDFFQGIVSFTVEKL
jgi:hypothetical protein